MLTVPLSLDTDLLPQHLADSILQAVAPLWAHPSILAVSAKMEIGNSDTADRWILPISLIVERDGAPVLLTDVGDVLALGDPTILTTLGTLQFALGRAYTNFGNIWGQYESLDGGETIETIIMPHAIGLRSTYGLDSAEEAVDALTCYAQEDAHDDDLLYEATGIAADTTFYPLSGILLLPAPTTAHATLAATGKREAMIARWERLAFYDEALPFPFSFPASA